MKSTRSCLAAATLLLLLPAAPARSASGSIASCRGSWRLTFSPGVGATARRSAFTTNGESATVRCLGEVRGHGVSGPGTFGQEGWLEGTALSGSGASTISLTIPTSAGPQRLSFPITMTYAPGIGLKHGDPLLGPLTFVYHPTAGNGLTEPVTEIAVGGIPPAELMEPDADRKEPAMGAHSPGRDARGLPGSPT